MTSWILKCLLVALLMVSNFSSLEASEDVYEDEYYYYYSDDSESAKSGEYSVEPIVDIHTAASGEVCEWIHNDDARFRLRVDAETMNAHLKCEFPLANDITLNRTQYLFSCKMKVGGRIGALQELRERIKSGASVEADNALLAAKLETTRRKTDVVIADKETREAEELRNKLGGRGMSASQRKAMSEKAELTNATTEGGSQSNNAATFTASTITATHGESPEEALGSLEDQNPGKKSRLQEAYEAKLKKTRSGAATAQNVALGEDATSAALDYRPECSSYVCQSCKLFTRELFSHLQSLSTDEQWTYLEDIIGADFCSSQRISATYHPVLNFLCAEYFLNNKFHFYFKLMSKLNSINDWTALISADRIASETESICVSLGACQTDDFHISFLPIRREQEEWSPECYICQAYADQLEERISLTSIFGEKSIVAIVNDICHYLQLSRDHIQLCTNIYGSKGRSRTITYMLKVLSDNLKKGKHPEKKFADALCEELKYCTKWEDPYEKMIRTIEMVYH